MNTQTEKHIKRYFTTPHLALIGILTALWVSLNLTIGRLGFQLFQLPVFCDVAVFLTLLLSVWAVEKFGAASIVGIAGSLITLLITGSPHNLGLSASAMIFDMLFLIVHHKVNKSPYNIGATIAITLTSAYLAGALIGLLWPPLNATLEYALVLWGGWHAIGGVLSLLITLPILGALEKANVQRLLHAK